ncbi:hypothetical protein FHR54_003512 [Xanthomonas arboricola]|uniref:hypothetical protein n=1 Tax=Xanthomonas cannabis TaxID=1885674 RepID=UPI00141B8C15|nr:hypothetical protein [Xanthomonas cannabis]
MITFTGQLRRLKFFPKNLSLIFPENFKQAVSVTCSDRWHCGKNISINGAPYTSIAKIA